MNPSKEKVLAAVKDVDDVIAKYGLDPVASVVNKRKKERQIERSLAAKKRELEGELERVQNSLKAL